MQPDPDVVAIIDAPPTPLASPAPGERFLILVHYQPHPPIATLAKPKLRLAGLRIDPVIGGRQRTRRFTGLSVLRVSDGATRELALPPDAQVSVPVWAPDGRRFAFAVDEADGIGVWTADAGSDADPVQVTGLRVRDMLAAEPPGISGAVHWSRDGRSLLALGVPGTGLAGAAGLAEPIEPSITETSGKRSQMVTYQDLLATEADEDRFEALATTVPLRVDPSSGAVTALGPAGLYLHLEESPDGRYLLVRQVRRPFSFRVPYGYFTRRIEVWSAAGEPVRVIADLGVSDEVPMMGVPTGPRQVSWDERQPARLIWTEALDGGDPMVPAEHREQIMLLAAPFDSEPELAFKLAHRCLGWDNTDAPDLLMLTERDRDRRWMTTWLCDLAAPERNRVLLELDEDDAYADPGVPMTLLHPDGTRTLRQHGSTIYMRGEGATPEGERPFLDRCDLVTGETTRLFLSPADAHEAVLCFVPGRTDQLVVWHESKAEPPNLLVVGIGSEQAGGSGPSGSGPSGSGVSPGNGAPDGAVSPRALRRLTNWPDPHPAVAGISKQLVFADRGDGVQLSGMLYLPPGHDPASDGLLPLVIWAYPNDFGSASTAGQVRGSSERFTWLSASDPAWFALRGYAVLADATMPVIGDPETKNDTYVEQVTAAAAAHIKALSERGIADPSRVAVAGHSYGAFMTATLLAHTDLFAAGIARSGAYNRTLTPFGFQTERRSFWAAPEVYDQVSAFRYANQISAPLLLVHGAEDPNPGTFPIQSERLFQAIGGTGGTARLVILPFEGHGYLSRESVLHVLAEQFAWLKRWLG